MSVAPPLDNGFPVMNVVVLVCWISCDECSCVGMFCLKLLILSFSLTSIYNFIEIVDNPVQISILPRINLIDRIDNCDALCILIYMNSAGDKPFCLSLLLIIVIQTSKLAH